MNQPNIQVTHEDLLNSIQEVYGRNIADALGMQARFKAGLAVAESMISSLQDTVEELQKTSEAQGLEITNLRAALDAAQADNRSLQAANDRLASYAPAEG